MLTTCVALLPISVGAVVTTVDAGMAFPDWPTSDGHNMLFYPWFTSAGEQFLEHGHRLAGMVIGAVCIALAGIAWKLETRRWARWTAYAILLAVILQGVLGGLRVLVDARVLAMVHGLTAALFISLVAAFSVVTSKRWYEANNYKDASHTNAERVTTLKRLASITVVLLVVQYLIGGMIRHLGFGLHEHLGGAAIATLSAIATVVGAFRTRISWVKRAASGLAAIIFIQLSLGVAAWITRFGFASIGYVAVFGSPDQVFSRSVHQICGVLLLTTAVVLWVRVTRLSRLNGVACSDAPSLGTLSVSGGVG